MEDDDDDDDTNAEAGEYMVGLHRLREWHFGRTTPMTTMMETNRDNEHNKDAMVHRLKTRLACGVVIVVVIRRLVRRANRR